jgi:hypothetical protein
VSRTGKGGWRGAGMANPYRGMSGADRRGSSEMRVQGWAVHRLKILTAIKSVGFGYDLAGSGGNSYRGGW